MARRRRHLADTTTKARKRPESASSSRSAPLTRGDVAVGAAAAIGIGVVYAVSAARDIVLGDTPELITAAVTLGVPHPPGYPLFTMVAHLFSVLLIGPVAFRVNLLAVACGAATATIVYFTALRLSGNRAASICAALVLAFAPLFWSWSLVAEVFSLNNLLAAAFLYFLVVWQELPERMGLLVAAAFVSGLALSNQQTIVLLGPAVLFLLWRRRNQLFARPRMMALSAGALFVGLLPYVYLPWAASRHPNLNWGDASSLERFLAVVTRKHFGTGQLINAPQFQGGSPAGRILALGASFGVIAGILLVLGAIHAFRRRRWYFWFSLVAFAFAGPIFAGYANINLSAPLTRFVLERFYLLPQVAVAPLIAFGVLLGADTLATLVPGIRRHATILTASVVVLAVVGGVVANYREIDQSRNHVTRRFAEDIFATLDPDSILVINGDEVIMPLTYLQEVEGYRPDVSLIVMPFLYTDWYVPQLRRHYPGLIVPFARYDGRSGTMKALVEANPGRPVAVVGITSEDSLKGSYWFYRRGLVEAVEPMSKDVRLDEMIADNEQLFNRYRPPGPESIKSHSLESSILTHYATPAFVVAQQCEQLAYYPQARQWYQRTLDLDPSVSQARDALARLPQ
jgi:Protein of unknown function (DUF2723)